MATKSPEAVATVNQGNGGKLPNRDKAAMLLMALPSGVREEILAALTEPWRAQLTEPLRRFERAPPPPDLLLRLADEVESRLATAEPPPASPPKTGDKKEITGAAAAPKSLPDGSKTAGRPDQNATDKDDFERLTAGDPAKLAARLASEQPATIAAVLNFMDAATASSVLKRLPVDKAGQSLLRLGTPLQTEVVRSILSTLLQDSGPKEVSLASRANGAGDQKLEKLQQLLRLQHPVERLRIFATIEQQDQGTAGRIRDRLYGLSDLLLLEDTSLQLLLKELSTEILAGAVAKAGADIKEKLERNMSKRARESFHEEMELAQTAPAGRGEEAQQLLMQNLVRLNAAGQLKWIVPAEANAES